MKIEPKLMFGISFLLSLRQLSQSRVSRVLIVQEDLPAATQGTKSRTNLTARTSKRSARNGTSLAPLNYSDSRGRTRKYRSYGLVEKRKNQERSDQSNCVDFKAPNRTDVLFNSPINLGLTNVLMDSNPISRISSILGQTMCHKEGRFRSIHNGVWNASNHQLVLDWEIKLLYLAIHDFHHRPARDEYQLRCNAESSEYHFECPDSKYLVMPLPDIGMGAGIRLTGVAHVLMAISEGRIPLFVTNAPMGPEILRPRWKLSSCERGDFQCVFMPTTPCHLPSSELVNATVLDEKYAVQLRRGGSLPKQFRSERVLIQQPRIVPAKLDIFQGIHTSIREKLYKRVRLILDEWKAVDGSSIDPGMWDVLQAAAERIQDRDGADPYHYGYGHRTYRIAHAVLIYLLRPNDRAKAKIRKRLSKIIPKNINAKETIGMPIRGSDKCEGESTCLPFEKYMNLAQETWHHQQLLSSSSNNSSSTSASMKRGNLILTTEDKAMFQMSKVYRSLDVFPLDFVVNEEDSFQGTGNAQSFGQQADDIIISSLTAMQMQFHAGHVYGNCCSNFHVMMFDFLLEGCGLVTDTPICLQETKKYNICCAWTPGEECKTIREEFKKQKESPKDRTIRETFDKLAKHNRTVIKM